MEESIFPQRQNMLVPISENVIQHFSCDLCDANFSSVINFKTHMDVHIKTHDIVMDPVINPLQTEEMLESPEPIERSSELGKIQVSTEISSEIPCTNIREFNRAKQVLQKNYKCPNCSKLFSTKGNRKKHFSMCTDKAKNVTEHLDTSENDNPLMCKLCLKCFSTKGNLYIHKTIHLSDKPFKCAQCSVSFSQKGNLKSHEKKGGCQYKQPNTYVGNQENRVPLSCNICHKIYKTKRILNLHLNIHCPEKPFKCKQCSNKFSQKGHIKGHVERKHKIDEQTTETRYVEHYFKIIQPPEPQTISSDKPCPTLQETHMKCKKCLATFPQKRRLNAHKKICKNQTEPLLCKTCNKCFKTKSIFRLHSNIHLAEKPFRCKMCYIEFSQKGNLKSHLNRRHTINKQEASILSDSIENTPGTHISNIKYIHRIIAEILSRAMQTNKTLQISKDIKHSKSTKENEISSKMSYLDRANLESKNQVKIERLKCPSTSCLSTFPDKLKLGLHIEWVHPDVKMECPHCREILESEVEMLSHTKPKIIGLLMCNHLGCGLSFSAKCSLIKHQRLEHGTAPEREDTRKLDYISRGVMLDKFNKFVKDTTSENASKVLAIKKSEVSDAYGATDSGKSFLCKKCDTYFTTKEIFHVHSKIHSLKKYQCLHCSEEFSKKGVLKRHTNIYHNMTEQIARSLDATLFGYNPLMCNTCQRCFKTKTILNIHKNTHLLTKPFKCTKCPEQFSQKGNMKVHEKKYHDQVGIFFTLC